MPIRKETIKEQIDRIKRAHPKRDLATGMMYNRKPELLVKRRKITLVGLFVSDKRTFLLRPHLFETKKKGKNAVQWEAWLAEHYGGILRDSILPNMEKRTNKNWRLYRIIGWIAGDSTRIVFAKTRRARNKTKRKGR